MDGVGEGPRVQPFDYTGIAASKACELKEYGIRLRSMVSKSTGDMIKIGVNLLAVKAQLEHGLFSQWVEREIGICLRTAQVYMSLARLAEGKSETVARFPPSTARMLASKSAPQQVIEQVMVRAGAGDLVPEIAVKRMIAEAKAERRLAKRKADLAERNSKAGRAAKAAKANSDEARRLAEHARELAERQAIAQAIIDRFSLEDVAFLVEVMTWPVFVELRRLVTEPVFARDNSDN